MKARSENDLFLSAILIAAAILCLILFALMIVLAVDSIESAVVGATSFEPAVLPFF